MVQVSWTREAVDGVEAARAYIAQFNPSAADRLANRLISAGESLKNFPNRGRPTRDDTRELPTIPPYIIRYEVLGDVVNILDVRHGSRQPPG